MSLTQHQVKLQNALIGAIQLLYDQSCFYFFLLALQRIRTSADDDSTNTEAPGQYSLTVWTVLHYVLSKVFLIDSYATNYSLWWKWTSGWAFCINMNTTIFGSKCWCETAQLTILPSRIELLITFNELTTNGTIIIFTSMNSELKTTS